MKENLFLVKAAELGGQFMRLDDLDHCVVGLSLNNKPVYSYSKMIDHFNKVMNFYEAIEWIDFNILPLQSPNTFLILYDYV